MDNSKKFIPVKLKTEFPCNSGCVCVFYSTRIKILIPFYENQFLKIEILLENSRNFGF